MLQSSTFKTKFRRPLVAPIAIASVCIVLSGCSKTVDCEPAAIEGARLANQGLPAQFDASGWDMSCESAYMSAWQSAKDGLCDPAKAFDRAMQGQTRPEICDAPSYARNFQLGANLLVLTEERVAIEKALAAIEQDPMGASQSQSLRMRLRVLEREIPNLEALAQMRGLMTPDDLPPELRPTPEPDPTPKP